MDGGAPFSATMPPWAPLTLRLVCSMGACLYTRHPGAPYTMVEPGFLGDLHLGAAITTEMAAHQLHAPEWPQRWTSGGAPLSYFLVATRTAPKTDPRFSLTVADPVTGCAWELRMGGLTVATVLGAFQTFMYALDNQGATNASDHHTLSLVRPSARLCSTVLVAIPPAVRCSLGSEANPSTILALETHATAATNPVLSLSVSGLQGDLLLRDAGTLTTPTPILYTGGGRIVLDNAVCLDLQTARLLVDGLQEVLGRAFSVFHPSGV